MPTNVEENGTRISVLLPANSARNLLAIRHKMERDTGKGVTISQVIRVLIANRARTIKTSV